MEFILNISLILLLILVALAVLCNQIYNIGHDQGWKDCEKYGRDE